MKPAFVGHPLPSALLGVTILIWIVVETRQALNRRPEASQRDRGSFTVVRLFAAAGAVLAALAVNVQAAAFPENSAVFAISLLVIWSGVALRFWCFRTLGHYFTFTVMTITDQPVITAGPYQLLRHPSYLAILLILAGIGLTYGNWLSLAALVVLPLIGFINRIRVEEAALSTELGARYTTYAASRKRLIPFVW